MHTACDCANEVRHGYSGVDEGKGGSIYAGLEGTSVLLQDLDVDVDLGTGVEVRFDHRLKRRLDRRCKL